MYRATTIGLLTALLAASTAPAAQRGRAPELLRVDRVPTSAQRQVVRLTFSEPVTLRTAGAVRAVGADGAVVAAAPRTLRARRTLRLRMQRRDVTVRLARGQVVDRAARTARGGTYALVRPAPPAIARSSARRRAARVGITDPTVPATTPRQASAFSSSVGVNVHMSYFSTSYGDFERVRDALTELGVQHIRDGACVGCKEQRRRLLALGDLGIKATWIMREPGAPDTVAALVGLVTGPMASMTAAVEGPNEFDRSGRPNWVQELRAWQAELYARMKSAPGMGRVPVLAPSLTDGRSYGRVGDLSGVADRGNVHPYAGGDVPGTNLAGNLDLARITTPGRRVVVTEAGYHNALRTTGGHHPVPERVGAAYIPRMYLEHFSRGIERTFGYELVDLHPDPARTDQEKNFGLVRADFSRKPAFAALKELLAVSGRGPSIPLERLRVEVEGEGVRGTLLQRAPGAYVAVVWRDAPMWGAKARRPIAVAAEDVVLRFGHAVSRAVTRRVDGDLTADSVAVAPSSVRVRVGAAPVAVEIRTASRGAVAARR